MKKQLLLCLSAGMTILVFSANGGGPAGTGSGNHTGTGPAPIANCSTGSGCHNTNTTNTDGAISITTLTGGAVTKYTPGTTYKIYVIGSNSSNLPRFGFQATCVKAASITTQAGAFASTSSNISVRTIDAIQIVEHNLPIAGNSGVYQAGFNWTAPAAGTGKVRFYSTLNAVNYTGTSANDQPNALPTMELDEGNSGVGIAAVKPASLSVYPNPATASLHLKLRSATASCNVRIFNLAGSVVAVKDAAVVNDEVSVDVATLAAGSYYVLAQSGGQSYGSLFTKQ